jgi:transposase InsO family protein
MALKALRSDNGGEYLSTQFKDYLFSHGITHHLSVPYLPSQNVVAERLNLTLVDMMRSIHNHSGLPKYMWYDALQMAIYVKNRVPKAALQGRLPYYCWFKRMPELSTLRVFGSVRYVGDYSAGRRKLDNQANIRILVGYGASEAELIGYKV